MEVKTAAHRMGLKPSAVYRRIRKGRIKAVRVRGRWCVFKSNLNKT